MKSKEFLKQLADLSASLRANIEAHYNDRYQSVKQAERDALDTYLKENHCKIHKIISYTHVKDKIEYLCGNGVTVVREVGDMSDLV